MSVKPDHWIRRMALEHKMIEPFTDRQMREGVISYGVSSYGYDTASPMNFAFSRTSIRPSWIPNILMRARSSSTREMSASFRRIPLRWPVGRIFSHSSATS